MTAAFTLYRSMHRLLSTQTYRVDVRKPSPCRKRCNRDDIVVRAKQAQQFVQVYGAVGLGVARPVLASGFQQCRNR